MKLRAKNSLLLLAVILLAALPFLGRSGGDFTGTDTKAGQAIAGLRPDYRPWFKPLWQPPGKETEAFLFAAQAAAGGGLVGYCLGYLKGRRERKSDV